MKKQVLLTAIIIYSATHFYILADDPLPKEEPKPEKPKAPGKYRICHYVVGDELIVESTVEANGSICIVDAETNAVVYQATDVTLYPEIVLI